jgi:hypothetical protein
MTLSSRVSFYVAYSIISDRKGTLKEVVRCLTCHTTQTLERGPQEPYNLVCGHKNNWCSCNRCIGGDETHCLYGRLQLGTGVLHP